MIALSVRRLSTGYYTEKQIESAIKFVFGVDTQLVADGTYYVVEKDGHMAGCGGWSKRKTLYGGDQHKEVADPLLDPKIDAARIRAFFVHPDFARQGVGRYLINVCELAAIENGFTSFELGATLPGVPLYLAMGYHTAERADAHLPDGEMLGIFRVLSNNLGAAAINYIRLNFKDQPNLDEVAANVNLSPYHFQRLFTDWAGVSPKKFLQYLSIDYAKEILRNRQATLFDAAFETGLSGTGRLHDLFMNIEGMTPAEFKNGGKALRIRYSFFQTTFGDVIVASTPKGICFMAFADEPEQAIVEMRNHFPNAAYSEATDSIQQSAISIFKKDWSNLNHIKLHLKGTDFQLKVWQALLNIPSGSLATYSGIASAVQSPSASRAVGSAVGANPSADSVYNQYLDFNLARFQGEQDKVIALGEAILPNAEKLPEKARANFYFSAVPDYYVAHRALGYLYADKAKQVEKQVALSADNKTMLAQLTSAYQRAVNTALPHLEKAQACDPDDDTLQLIKTLHKKLNDEAELNSLDERLRQLPAIPFIQGDQTKLQHIYLTFHHKWEMIFPAILIIGFIALLITCAVKKYEEPDLNWLLVLNSVILIAYGIAIFIRISHMI
eukprot:gene3762-3808_t